MATFKKMIKQIVPLSLRRSFHRIDWRKSSIAGAMADIDSNIRTIFDIGANVGDVSLYMLFRFPEADVYSFEPCQGTFDVMSGKIVASEYAGRSHRFKLGFYDAETKGTLNVSTFHGANSMVDMTDEYRAMNPHIATVGTEEIPLVRLDDFVAQHGINHIDLVKIDVEGVELQVLRGGKETFSTKVDTVVMEISFVRHPRESGDYLKILETMHEYGFAPSEIYDIEHSGSSKDWKLAQFDCVFRRYR